LFLDNENLKITNERQRKEILERARADMLTDEKIREVHEKLKETREELSSTNSKLRKVV
jgi:hypothetical protein